MCVVLWGTFHCFCSPCTPTNPTQPLPSEWYWDLLCKNKSWQHLKLPPSATYHVRIVASEGFFQWQRGIPVVCPLLSETLLAMQALDQHFYIFSQKQLQYTP